MPRTPLDIRLALLGAGMMGGALVRGFVNAGALDTAHIALFDTAPDAAKRLADELGSGARAAESAIEAVKEADFVLVAVKPPSVLPLLQSIAPSLTPSQLVVSIAAGVTLAKMEAILPGIPLIRVMPNTPALIGQGAAALSRGTHATDSHLALALEVFAAVGQVLTVEEKLMDAVTGLSGSGPAYVYLMIEALTDGGVKAGLPRPTAHLLAAQTVLGAAQMVISTGEHPARLKDNVTTPGGTTISGLAVLERAGVRAALIDAVQTATDRSKELSG